MPLPQTIQETGGGACLYLGWGTLSLYVTEHAHTASGKHIKIQASSSCELQVAKT